MHSLVSYFLTIKFEHKDSKKYYNIQTFSKKIAHKYQNECIKDESVVHVFNLRMLFVVMLVNDSNVLIQPEDCPCQQRNAAHDEQHCTGILRDFKTFVFHKQIAKKVGK